MDTKNERTYVEKRTQLKAEIDIVAKELLLIRNKIKSELKNSENSGYVNEILDEIATSHTKIKRYSEEL